MAGDIFESEIEKTECVGPIYRADVQMCKTKRGVLFSVRLNKLIKLSCPGCSSCGGLEDTLSEIDRDSFPLVGIEAVENGRLYTLRATNITRDWESGIIDGWDLEVVEVKE